MKNFLREDLIDLRPYDATQITCTHKMDANESPWDMPLKIREGLAEGLIKGCQFNIYPDSNADDLREAIGKVWGLSSDGIIIGSGSDELIQTITIGVVDKGDRVVYPVPSFGMYRIFTLIAGGIPAEVPLGNNFDYNLEDFSQAVSKNTPKLVFFCSPNNPTGNSIDPLILKDFVGNFPGVVVVDEAYGEFCGRSMIEWVKEFPNLVVLRTLSKAFGLAGLRIGYCITNPKLANQLNKVKPPYNINTFSQKAAILALNNMDLIKERTDIIVSEREAMYKILKTVGGIKVYPSQGNFLLIKVPDGHIVWQKLLQRGILVRDFSNNPYLEDCLRVTVSHEKANRDFIEALKDILET